MFANILIILSVLILDEMLDEFTLSPVLNQAESNVPKDNLNIYGVSNPYLLSLKGSAVSFVSPKQVLEDIGHEISHTYTIENMGSLTIMKAEITILWPTRDPNGNYLLYLVDQPIVSSRSGKGFCESISADDLNPLGLRLKQKSDNDVRPSPDTHPSVRNPNTRYINDYDMKKDIYSSRTKREDNGNKYLVPASKRHQLTIEQAKSCGIIKCTKIICNVSYLRVNETVSFTIPSRFWRENIELDDLEEFQISSKLVALVNLGILQQTVSTKFFFT